MTDMLNMLRLRHFKDPKGVGPDNSTTNDRIGDLMEKIAQDIQNAGSVCDYYLKKSTICMSTMQIHFNETLPMRHLARIMKSIQLQGVFARHVTILVKDREDLHRALQIHISAGVDSANARLESIDRKIEMIFKQLETSHEQDVQKFIKVEGGAQNCIDHKDLLAQFIQKSGKGYDDILGPQFESNKPLSETMEKARKELRREWQEDVERAFGNHMKNFEKKLKLQGQQLQDIDDAMRTGHSQILNAIKSGAHDRIIDYVSRVNLFCLLSTNFFLFS